MDVNTKICLLKSFSIPRNLNVFILSVDRQGNPIYSIELKLYEFEHYDFTNLSSYNDDLTFMIRFIENERVLPAYQHSVFEGIDCMSEERDKIMNLYKHPIMLVK